MVFASFEHELCWTIELAGKPVLEWANTVVCSFQRGAAGLSAPSLMLFPCSSSLVPWVLLLCHVICGSVFVLFRLRFSLWSFLLCPAPVFIAVGCCVTFSESVRDRLELWLFLSWYDPLASSFLCVFYVVLFILSHALLASIVVACSVLTCFTSLVCCSLHPFHVVVVFQF